MIGEDLDARLTAYAVGDPGLTDHDRAVVEAELAADPAQRAAVAATRKLAGLLREGLAAELAATPAAMAVSVPSSLLPGRPPRWRGPTAVLAAGLLLATVAGLLLPGVERGREVVDRLPAGVPTRDLEAARADVKLLTQDESAIDKLGYGLPAARSGNGRPDAAQGPGPAAAADRSKTDDANPAAEELKKGYQAPLGALPALKSSDGRIPAPGQYATNYAGGIGGGIGGVNGIGGGIQGGSQGGGKPGSQSFAESNSPDMPALPPAAPASQYGYSLGRTAGQPGGNLGAAASSPPQAAADAAPTAPAAPSPPRPEQVYGREFAGRAGYVEGSTGQQAAGLARRMGEAEALATASRQRQAELGKRAALSLSDAESQTADRYPALIENAFIEVQGQAALSTFGVDVDTASYSIARKYLSMNQLPPPDAVRLEELVNYFPYQDKAPTDPADPFAVTVEVADCPWASAHRLARIGLKARPIDTDKRPPSNLVFLVDVSGSMDAENRLPLVKASLKLLVNRLGENDRVALVAYAGASGLVLDSTSAINKGAITAALDRLGAGGSTNGAGGIVQAYEVAAAHFIKGGTNRVIVCTDGDWNVGPTSTEALIALIEQKRTTGVFLSVLGFGMGNLRDEMMVQLAGKGNGNYAYIDTLREANKALVEQLGGTLVTVAKDVKIQVEFNPAAVKAYRLLGYEKRALAARDFADDRKDAGEMGAGHVVTALYELVPAGAVQNQVAQGEQLLRYQQNPVLTNAAAIPSAPAVEAFVVKMRHKKPDGDVSQLRELPVANKSKPVGQASEDWRFAAAVAEFAMILRHSPYKGTATFGATLELADGARTHDPGAYRAEFSELVRKAKAVSGQP